MTDFTSAAVVGASGKMGRGIALLLLYELSLSDQKGSLCLIDIDKESFFDLKSYLKQHLKRFAERNIISLRTRFADRASIVSNEEAVDQFLDESMALIDCSSQIEHVKGSELVFEAAFEEVSVKVSLLKQIAAMQPKAVFTNTSSIPIHLLAEKSGLNEKLIGYHFYNPPPVQKLLEIIPSKYTSKELMNFSLALAKKLGKTAIVSQDRAGFIGNGHFAREILYACSLIKDQERDLCFLDHVTRNVLLRPMGIFQLLDYVGLFVAKNLLEIMRENLPDASFRADLLTDLYAAGIRGGQEADGSQKDGIFRYEKAEPVEVFSLKTQGYVALPAFSKPSGGMTWKKALKEKIPLKPYFENLLKSHGEQERSGIDFLSHSKEIEELLVKEKVAASLDDVGTVLKEGFHHLYAPHEVI